MGLRAVAIRPDVRKMCVVVLEVLFMCELCLCLVVRTHITAEESALSKAQSQHTPPSPLITPLNREHEGNVKQSMNSEHIGLSSAAQNGRYLLNANACAENTFLVILVSSSPEHFEQRSAIRDTWGRDANCKDEHTVLLFMLGVPEHANNSHAASIERESHSYRDIVQEDFIDTYSNLSLKSVAILRWVNTFCSKTKFVLKTDDDMFINIHLLLKDLHNAVHKRFIMGHIIAGAVPSRDTKSKWYTPPSEYPENHYPNYVSGTAYVISGDLVSDLYNSATSRAVFWIEDVFITGLCAEKVKATHVFNSKFGYKKRLLSPCLFRIVITAHRLTPYELRRIWTEFSRTDMTCDYSKIHLNILT